MPKFRVAMTRQTAVRKDGTPMTATQLFAVRDVFAVRGRIERRIWEFEAADEAEVRKWLEQAVDHPNVRGFDLESITLADGVQPHSCRWIDGICIDCGRLYGAPRGVAGTTPKNLAPCEVDRDVAKCWRRYCVDAKQCTAPDGVPAAGEGRRR